MTARDGRTETYVGVGILLTLVVIASGVLLKQSRYDPSLFIVDLPREETASTSTSDQEVASRLESFLPEGLQPLTPPETFGPENLSDKINGKAELYLSAGFQSLQSQRFTKSDNPDAWMEVFVFDMGGMKNAFSVYSVQRRADAEDAGFARFAYRTENTLFFVHGQEYIEIIAATEDLAEEMLAVGRSFVQQKPAEAETLGEPALFPSDRLDEGTIILHASDVFGFHRLNRIYTAKYDMAGEEVRAFLSVRESPEDASDLAAAYHQFLLENGGADLEPDANIPGARFVEIFDLYEVIFSHGKVLAGVHEAESRDSAGQLALMLYRELQEGAP